MSLSHIMVDAETLGTRPGAILLSLGARAFDPFTGQRGEWSYYVNIDRRSCEIAGLVADPQTEAWWADPECGEARAALEVNPVPLGTALAGFDVYYGQHQGDRLWCQGPSFDQVLLDAAYRAVGWATPYRYNAGRDTRTVYDMTGIRPDTSEGLYHNALDDCDMQITAIVAGFRKLGLCP